MVMSLMSKHMSKFKADDKTGLTTVNVALIKKTELSPAGKDAFRMEEFAELVKLGYASNLNVKSTDEVFTNVKADEFVQSYRLQRIVIGLNAANEQKRKAAK
jgi:hypothetical protein